MTLFALVVLAICLPATVGARPIICSQSERPPTRFESARPPREAMHAQAFAIMLPALRQEGERLLRDDDIQDTQLRSQLVVGVAALAVLDRRKDDALHLVATYRDMQSKPQMKRPSALATELTAVQIDVPEGQRCEIAAAQVSGLLANTDPAVVRDRFLSVFGNFQVASAAPLNAVQGLTLALWRQLVGVTSLPKPTDCSGARKARGADEPTR